MKIQGLTACVALVLGAVVLPAGAELVATPLQGDARLVQFEYDPDNTYLILARPKSVTHMEFGSDERIATVAGGDTKNWELTPTANRHHLFIKPVYDSIETSMTVITDKRSYQFVLRSTGAGSKWYQRVTWRNGKTMLLDLRAEEERAKEAVKVEKAAEKNREEQTLATNVRPENLRFGYVISGEAAFRPVSIFDDGKMTWIRMPSNLNELPALFAASDGEELAVVNYVIKGDYVLAQRLMDTGVLKLGNQVVKFGLSKPSRGILGFGGTN